MIIEQGSSAFSKTVAAGVMASALTFAPPTQSAEVSPLLTLVEQGKPVIVENYLNRGEPTIIAHNLGGAEAEQLYDPEFFQKAVRAKPIERQSDLQARRTGLKKQFELIPEKNGNETMALNVRSPHMLDFINVSDETAEQAEVLKVGFLMDPGAPRYELFRNQFPDLDKDSHFELEQQLTDGTLDPERLRDYMKMNTLQHELGHLNDDFRVLELYKQDTPGSGSTSESYADGMGGLMTAYVASSNGDQAYIPAIMEAQQASRSLALGAVPFYGWDEHIIDPTSQMMTKLAHEGHLDDLGDMQSQEAIKLAHQASLIMAKAVAEIPLNTKEAQMAYAENGRDFYMPYYEHHAVELNQLFPGLDLKPLPEDELKRKQEQMLAIEKATSPEGPVQLAQNQAPQLTPETDPEPELDNTHKAPSRRPAFRPGR